jgi:hypothetical protein
MKLVIVGLIGAFLALLKGPGFLRAARALQTSISGAATLKGLLVGLLTGCPLT